MLHTSIIIVFLILAMVSEQVISNDCKIIINEINQDNPEIPEFYEYIEIKKIDCSPQKFGYTSLLNSYVLLLVKEFDDSSNLPVIVLSIDFKSIKYTWTSDLLVIGSPSVKLSPNITFHNENVMYNGKLFKSRVGIDLGLYSDVKEAPFNMKNFLQNGNEYIMGFILVKETIRTNGGLNRLSLDYSITPRQHVKLAVVKPIDSDLETIIKAHIVDLFIYARRAKLNSCGFFKRLIPSTNGGILKVATEWDADGYDDVSVNRCPSSSDANDIFFSFSHFKLGKPSPHMENHCTGPHYLLYENIDDIMQMVPPMLATTSARNVPEPCQSSSYITELSMLTSAAVVENRECAIQNARSENVDDTNDVCVCNANTPSSSTSLDNTIDSLLISITNNEHDETGLPACKKVKFNNNVVSGAIKPWEDSSMFQDSWMQQIIRHQGQYVPQSLLKSSNKIWIEYLINMQNPEISAFRCRFCNSFVQKTEKKFQNLPLLSKEQGFFTPNYKTMYKRLSQHTQSDIHKKAILQAKQDFLDNLKQCGKAVADKDISHLGGLVITSRMIRTVYAEIKMNIPFDSHNDLVTLQKLNGVDLGTHHADHMAAKRMTETISSKMHNILIQYIKTKKMPFSILIDTSTDQRNRNYMFIFIRTVENFWPVSYFYRSIHIQSETSSALLDSVSNALREDGLYDSFTSNCYAIATDGAPVMQGKKGGLAKLLNDASNNNLYTTHCMAHKLQLAITHSLQKFPDFKNRLETTINGIYSFYNDKSFKRKEALIKLSEEMGNTFYELNYIFTSRWVSSEFSALNRILVNYRSLVHSMQTIVDDKSYNTEVSARASSFKNTLLHPRFFITLMFMLDVLNLLKRTSLQCQETSTTLIGNHCIFDKLVQDLEWFKTENGEFMNNFMSNGKCLKETIWHACTNEDLDNCNIRMKLQGEDIVFSNNQRTRQEEERWPRLSTFRTQFIESVISEIHSYFPEGSTSMFDVFNPSSLPKNMKSVPSYSKKIIQVAERFQFNSATLITQFSALLQFLITEMNNEYCAHLNSAPHEFWSHFLNSNTLKWDTEIKQLVTIVLILPVGTADVERSFSVLNHFKSNRRSRLTSKHVEDITRIRINGPHISDFDAPKYAVYWLNTGHKDTDDVTKSDGKLRNQKQVVHKSGLF